MNHRFRWSIIVGALLLAAAVGVIAYNAGFAQGMEETGKILYVGHRPWGFGFLFFPLFFVGLMLLAFRGFRGHHRHYACRYEQRDTQVKDA